VSLHSSLLDWENDSLKVGIAKSKRNYNVVPVYYHVFSNPIQPEICPILSLALHCCVNKHILNFHSKLFRSNSSKNNGVSSLFRSITESIGLQGLGAHSIRKGAIMFASTGTPDSAPFACVQVRARWKSSGPDGTLHKRYIKFEASGDQFIGRILAGLPIQSHQFALLPPQFQHEARIQSTLIFVFGDVCPRIQNLCRYLLAALVYHLDWLNANLCSSHAFWRSSFTRIPEDEITSLRNQVTLMDSENGSQGIPVSVKLLEKQHVLEQSIEKIVGMLQHIGFEQERISEVLSLSAAASGMMVGERQLGSLKEFIDASIRNAFQSSTSSIGMSECGLQRPRDYQFFSWGGKMRHVPARFKLVRPGSTLAEIWDLWWLGDLSPESPVRPFRQILKNNRALEGNTEFRTLEGITSTQLWQSSG